MTTTHPRPDDRCPCTLDDVPLPDGAYVLADWADYGNECRMISTHRTLVSGSRVLVSATAVQLPDGSINAHPANDPPSVFLDELDDQGRSCDRLTISAEAARKLGQALVELADQADGWAAK